MLYDEKQITELYNLKHMNDDKIHQPNYNNFLRNFLSPVLYNNSNMRSYLDLLEKMVLLMIDEMNYVRNFYHTSVDKHYNEYNN